MCSPYLLALCTDDGDDAGGTDGAENLRSGVVSDRGGRITALFLEPEEDIDDGLDRAELWRTGPKV